MINTLTSLRLFFALMVFGAHCYVVDSTFSTHFYKEGFVGVSFFFILSGFIIAYNYQQKLVERKVSKRQFWVARIARIYPLHIATLLGVAVIITFNSIDSLKSIDLKSCLASSLINAATIQHLSKRGYICSNASRFFESVGVIVCFLHIMPT